MIFIHIEKMSLVAESRTVLGESKITLNYVMIYFQ